MAGGEEGVSPVQHARLAARPAGWWPRARSANTAASAWHRERGVAAGGAASWTASLTFLYRYTSDSREPRTSRGLTPDHETDFRLWRRVEKPQFLVSHIWRTMKKRWWWRSSAHGSHVDRNFFTTKALFFLGASAKTRKREKKAKNFKYMIFFLFNKHFMRSLTLIACDCSSKIVFYILTIISMYNTKPLGF